MDKPIKFKNQDNINLNNNFDFKTIEQVPSNKTNCNFSFDNAIKNKIKSDKLYSIINSHSLWQNVIKSLYQIDDHINLDDELINITLETSLNSFFIYFNENKNEINADEYKNNKFIEIRKKMITNWKKLSDEEKAPYIKKQNEEIKRYEIELAIIRKYLLLEKVYNRF